MNGYQLQFPEKILFGNGKRRELPSLLPSGPVLILCGKHSLTQIESELIPSLGNRKFSVLSNIQSEPPLGDVDRAVKEAREIGATSVIGWGGGSVMDTAKSTAPLVPLEGSVSDYFYGKRKITGKGLFFAALPTTAGTGAEITGNAVLSDPVTGIKQSLRGEKMVANVAIVDPELTYDCPPDVTAASGFDALTQAIESYISRNANTVSRALSLQAAEMILSSLPSAWEGDKIMRSDVAEGSMLAAMAFSSSGLGAVHGIGHPLGSICHIPHGICCAILLPTILKWNLESCREELRDLSEALIRQKPETFLELLIRLRRHFGLPENFRTYGLKPEHFDFIVRNCRSGSMRSNPRELSDDDVRAILKELA